MRSAATRIDPLRITLDDGTYAQRDGAAIELRDADDRLLVRFVDGHAEISAPSGDLRLAAPNGRVSIAGRVVSLEADQTELRLEHDRVHVRSKLATALIEGVELTARNVKTSAARVITEADQWEVIAERTVQKSRDALREVAGLAEERFGRMRAMVRGAFTLSSRRTSMRSSEETSIDGKRVLLG